MEGSNFMSAEQIEDKGLDVDRLKELASIARLITYARQSAKGLNVDFSVWCLDLALNAVLQEMYATPGAPLEGDITEGRQPPVRH